VADVVFVIIIVGFFALAGLLVSACDRIIGPAEESRDTSREGARPTKDVAA